MLSILLWVLLFMFGGCVVIGVIVYVAFDGSMFEVIVVW